MKAGEFQFPEDRKYVPGHVWVKAKGKEATVGITEMGASFAKEIVHIDLPDDGEEFEYMRPIATYETIKSVIQVPAPYHCRITAVNEKLLDNPSLMNSDPYGDGWVAKIEIIDEKDAKIMDAKEAAKYYGEILRKEKEKYKGVYD